MIAAMTDVPVLIAFHSGNPLPWAAGLALVGAIDASGSVKRMLALVRSNKLIAFLIVAWCAASWSVANYYYDHLADEFFLQESQLASQQADSIASSVDDSIAMLKGIALMHSRDEEVRRVLLRFNANSGSATLTSEDRKQRWSRNPALMPLNQFLSANTPTLGADLIFVLDAAGNCVAASNAGQPGSPVGTNYADRKYFPLARAGKPAHQYAVGRTTGIPGLYFVSPVMDQERFIGAVVVKRDIAKFSRWTNPVNAFVTDANGVIVLAPDQRFELRTMPDATLSKLSQHEILAQYRQNSLLPLKMTPWGEARFSSAVFIEGSNQPTLLFSRHLADDGITIHVPRALDEIVHLKSDKFRFFVLLVVTGGMLIIAVATANVYRRKSRRKDAITATFGKYVDPRIVQVLLEERQLAQNGDKRVMTVYFCDLEGFTSISEKFNPEWVVEQLNRYLLLMSEPIRQSNGIIDKYIGDSIMAFWGPPFTRASDHPRFACLAALQQIEALKRFETHLPDLPKFNVRIGISTGEVIVGSIGSEVARSYTVIGDNVNLASRLESINKYYGTQILICDSVWEMVKDDIECREIDHIRVVGKVRPIRIYEVMGKKGELDDTMLELRRHFEAGLADYRASRWDDASAAFEKCLELNPHDQVSEKFLSRIALFRKQPPGSDWDGIWTFYRK